MRDSEFSFAYVVFRPAAAARGDGGGRVAGAALCAAAAAGRDTGLAVSVQHLRHYCSFIGLSLQ